MNFDEKLEQFRATLENQRRAVLRMDGMKEDLLNHSAYSATAKPGRKYVNVDFGNSGIYMVVRDTGEIFGIKGYGVIHRGHYYGTLDTIADYDWSGYTAVKRQPAKAAA